MDVRGSTTFAESMTPSDYSAALNVFYKIVSDAVDSEHGIIDHMAGEAVYSERAAEGAVLDPSSLEHKMLDLKGKADPFPVWVETMSRGAQ